MNKEELIEELILELSLVSDKGLPDLRDRNNISFIREFFRKKSLTELGEVVIQNLFEEEKQFKNPVLNKVIKYTNTQGEEAEGLVGNLLRRPKTEDAYIKAVAALGGEGSDTYKKAMDDLGSEGQPNRNIEKEREKGDGGETGGEEPQPQTPSAFDKNADGGKAYLKNLPDGDPAKPEEMKDDSEETLSSGGVVYPVGGGYYADTPGGEPKYKDATDEGVDVNHFKYILETEAGEDVVKKVVYPKNPSDTETKKLTVIGDKEADFASKNIQSDVPKKEPSTGKKGRKKNKQLDQKIDTSSEFNEGTLSQDGVSDEIFNSNTKVKKTQSQIDINDLSKYFTDDIGKTKFPKKYLKVLTRLLNTKAGSGLTISDFTDVSGAGTLSSTMGELLTMASATIKDDAKLDEFYKMISNHIKMNGKDSIVDIGWLKAAKNARNVLYNRYDRMYGKGNWELEQMAWDTQSEVEALGLQSYKDNKGFSTDTYAKIKVNGNYILDEISLKKELKANLLNSTSGRVQDIMVRGAASYEDLKRYEDLNTKIDALIGLKDKNSISEKNKLIDERDLIIQKYNVSVPDDAKVSYAQKKQRELHQEFIQNASAEVEDFFNNFCNKDDVYKTDIATSIKNKMNQKDDYVIQVTKKMNQLCEGIQSGLSYEAVLMKNEGKSDYQKLNLSVMIAIAEKNDNSQASKIYKSIVENSHNHSKSVRKFLLEDKNARNGLFASIRESFPLKALFEGEENMILGDVSADRQVLQDVFGVEDFSELEQRLTIRDLPPPPSIVYRVIGKEDEDIPIAEISSRPDGIGYGSSWKLEMKVHDEFGKKLKESNLKLNK